MNFKKVTSRHFRNIYMTECQSALMGDDSIIDNIDNFLYNEAHRTAWRDDPSIPTIIVVVNKVNNGYMMYGNEYKRPYEPNFGMSTPMVTPKVQETSNNLLLLI